MRRKLSRSRSKIKVGGGERRLPSQKRKGVCGLADGYLWGSERRGIRGWEDVGGVAGRHLVFAKVRKEGMPSA